MRSDTQKVLEHIFFYLNIVIIKIYTIKLGLKPYFCAVN
jgi:hypothetical protein